jgi:hypothetical protein
MRLDLPGLAFQPLTLEHGPQLAPMLARHPQPLSGYTFATFAAWNPSFHYCWAQHGTDSLLFSFELAPDPNRHLLQPIGMTDELAARILEGAAQMSRPLQLWGVGDPFLERHPGFVASFQVQETPASSNYLYSAEDLATLAGKRFSKKRNLIAQARKLYQWTVEPLGPANLEGCREVLREIRVQEKPLIQGTLAQELAALIYSIDHWEALGQKGILIRVEGQPAAFSIFEPMSPRTMVIHFERALRRYKGLYQIVNQEAAVVARAAGFEFINREEDLGDPGLRQAKMSYNPVELSRSYVLTYRSPARAPAIAQP